MDASAKEKFEEIAGIDCIEATEKYSYYVVAVVMIFATLFWLYFCLVIYSYWQKAVEDEQFDEQTKETTNQKDPET